VARVHDAARLGEGVVKPKKRRNIIMPGDELMLVVKVVEYRGLGMRAVIKAPRLIVSCPVYTGNVFKPEVSIGLESAVAIKEVGSKKWNRKLCRGGSAELNLKRKNRAV